MSSKKRNPVMSMNKLAEYSKADALRRREIITQMKQDRDFNKVRYQAVKAALGSYFRNGYDNAILDRTIQRLRDELANNALLSDWDKSDKNTSIEALIALRASQLPQLQDYAIVSDIAKLDSIQLSGVTVIVKPELYLRHSTTGKVGGLKFHTAKTEKHRLDRDSMICAATIIKSAYIQYGFSEKEIDDNACISIGIFEKDHAPSPKAYKRTMNSLGACCQEIVRAW